MASDVVEVQRQEEARNAEEYARRLREQAADGKATISPKQGERNANEPANPADALSAAQRQDVIKGIDSASPDSADSESVLDALLWAKATADARRRNIDAHTILIGLFLHCRSVESKDAAHFLWDWFNTRRLHGTRDLIEWIDNIYGLADSIAIPDAPAKSYAPADFDPNALALLATAAECAEAVSNKNQYAMRHLVGALFLGPTASIHARNAGLVGEKGFDFQKLARDYLKFLGKIVPREHKRWLAWAWTEASEEVAQTSEPEQRKDSQPIPSARSGPGSIRAGYDADLPVGADHLNIEDEVATLCSVVLDEKHPPPLSIGLFGDWGSGKSFFLGKMKDRIRDVTEETRAARERGMPTAFVSRAPQIEFNAWHFVDANLWASLVTHLFSELHREIFGERPSPDEEKAEQLYKELQTTQKRVETLERDVRAATDLVDEAKEKKNQAELDLLRGKKTIEIFRRMGPQTLRELVLHNPEVRSQYDRLMKTVGEGRDAAIEIDRVVTDFFTTFGKLRRFVRENPGLTAVIAVLFLAGTLLSLPLAQDYLNSQLASLSRAVSFLAGTLVLLGKGVPFLNQVKAMLKTAEGARQDILRVEQGAVDRAELAQKEALERLSEQQTIKQRLEKEIEEARRGLGLEGFLQQRLGDSTYIAHLGIVAMVRQDFDTLTDRLRNKGIELVDPQSKQTMWEKVDRIILYIDDLDRCPPDRVVEVLQAVHLLLAVPLFVVVVAADPRWLLHSLRKHYAELLETSGDDKKKNRVLTEEETRWESTPQQYLEKIFQIPYTLPAMEESGFRELVKNLLTQVAVEPPLKQASQSPSAPTTMMRPEDSPLPSRLRLQGSGGIVTATPITEPIATPDNLGPAPAAKPLDVRAKKTELPKDWKPTFDLAPHSLELTDKEKAFLEELSSFVSTPRSTKRLINVYRLLRANLGPDSLARLVAGEFRVAQILLATLIGFPDQAPELFLLLHKEEPEKNFWSFVKGKARNEPRTSTNDQGSHDVREWSRMCLALEEIQKLCSGTATIKMFAAWVDEVSRYSFRAGHLLKNLGSGTATTKPATKKK